MSCIHFRADVVDRDVCFAFPDGIPKQISDAAVAHQSAFKGDQGVRWFPKPGLEFLASMNEVVVK